MIISHIFNLQEYDCVFKWKKKQTNKLLQTVLDADNQDNIMIRKRSVVNIYNTSIQKKKKQIDKQK